MVKNDSFVLKFFLKNIQIYEIFIWFGFHQVYPMNMYFHRRGHVLLYKKFEINCMILYITFDFFS